MNTPWPSFCHETRELLLWLRDGPGGEGRERGRGMGQCGEEFQSNLLRLPFLELLIIAKTSRKVNMHLLREKTDGVG